MLVLKEKVLLAELELMQEVYVHFRASVEGECSETYGLAEGGMLERIRLTFPFSVETLPRYC